MGAEIWPGPWRRNPIAAIGVRHAPVHDPLVGIETPYCKWLGTSRAMNARAWGVDARAWLPTAIADPRQDNDNAYANPAAAPERIQWFDAFDRVRIEADEIDTLWRSWEVARFVVPTNAMASIDKHPTSIDSVVALNDVGNPIFAYGPQNGRLATVESLLHPTPGVGSLEWRWHLTAINQGYSSDTPAALVGSLASLGRDLVEPWRHQSNGADVVWAARQQILVGASSLVRLFIQLRGPTDRFTVQAGARLSGYVQQGGHLGAALLDATRRTG